MSEFIRLKEVARQGNRLEYRFTTSLPYFKKDSFYVEYEAAAPATPSLEAIPFAAVMAPVAWATGAEVTMPELDRDYLDSLSRCREYFRRWFSKKWAFSSHVKAEPVVNESQPKRTGMLFSSGLDSLATFSCHQGSSPVLFTIFGADIPVDQRTFIRMCRERFGAFAAAQKADIRFIASDVRDVLRYDRLRRFSKSWYGEVAHGLMMTSLVAPAAHGTVRELLVASCSHRPGGSYACGGEKELIQGIRWAGTSLKNDNHHLSRPQKIARFLKARPDLCASLRVCWTQFRELNCGRCEKCLRTVCELLANGIDPALCNFEVDPAELKRLRRRMENGFHFFFASDSVLDFWRDLQDHAIPDAALDKYGARDFFAWFAGFSRLRRSPNATARAACGAIMEARHAASHAYRAVRGLQTDWAGTAAPFEPAVPANRTFRRIQL